MFILDGIANLFNGGFKDKEKDINARLEDLDRIVELDRLLCEWSDKAIIDRKRDQDLERQIKALFDLLPDELDHEKKYKYGLTLYYFDDYNRLQYEYI